MNTHSYNAKTNLFKIVFLGASGNKKMVVAEGKKDLEITHVLHSRLPCLTAERQHMQNPTLLFYLAGNRRLAGATQQLIRKKSLTDSLRW